MSTISASIVLYNTNKEILDESISSYLNSSHSGELWIIDNSKEAEYNYLKNSHKRIYYRHNKTNFGYGKAHNLAISNFIDKTDYHLVLNPDVSFSEDVINELTKYLDNNSNVGLIAPRAEYPDGSFQSNGRLIPSPIHLFLRRFLFINKFNLKINTNYELKSKQEDYLLSPVILGSFMMFRNTALKEVGLFDEHFFLYPEDIDISRRIFEKYDNIIYSKQNFTHHHSRDSYSSLKLLLTHIKEMFKYFNKWGWFFDNQRKIANNRALKV